MSEINPSEAGKAVPFLNIFASAFLISSLAGLARLLKSYPISHKIPTRMYISVVLSSGMMGLIITLLWYHIYSENVTFLLGISALAGIGGMTVLDFIILLVKKKIGVKIEFSKKENKKNDDFNIDD